MVAPVVITDPAARMKAEVTSFGQLVVAPISYSIPLSVKMDVVDTAFTLVNPKQGYAIVITDILLVANKNVGVNDATVNIYSAATEGDTSPLLAEVVLEMQKNTSLPLVGLNFLIPEGRFLLAKTDDNDIFITIGYYRVKI